MNTPTLEFVIFCIEEAALKLRLPGNLVYDMLAEKSDILESYLIPSFDVLHTQSREYIIDDLLSLMRECGVLA